MEVDLTTQLTPEMLFIVPLVTALLQILKKIKADERDFKTPRGF